jgi:hypothetical protein
VDLTRINEYGKEALRQLLFHYPIPVQRETCTINLRTMRVLERDELVLTRVFYDNDDWPQRKTRASDKTWSAELTGKGVHVALLLGFEPHSLERCSVPGSCSLHTPFVENRIKMPTLDDHMGGRS